jgi:hypothetical protein
MAPVQLNHPRAFSKKDSDGILKWYLIAKKWPVLYYGSFGLLPGSYTAYGDHGFVRVCCGKGEKRKCMYFDVGSKSYTGHYGGEDNWFSPEDNDFLDEMDLNFETPWNGL